MLLAGPSPEEGEGGGEDNSDEMQRTLLLLVARKICQNLCQNPMTV